MIPPCPYCGGEGGARVFSGLAARTYGQDRGSCHLACDEEVADALRPTGRNPAEWPAMLRYLNEHGSLP